MTKLREHLKEQGITQAAFAERIGVSQSAVSKICSGLITPRLVKAEEIERETGGAVPATALIGQGKQGARA